MTPDDERQLLVAGFTANDALFIREALRVYMRHCRRIGERVPPAVQALQRQISVMSSHVESPPPPPHRGVDPEHMTVRVVTKTGAAELLSCSVSTVDRLIRAGDLTTVQLGPGCTRIRVADINAYLAALPAQRPHRRTA